MHGYAWPVLVLWPDGARAKVTSAVRAYIPQFIFHTILAKGALIGANHRLPGIGRQILVAEFTVRSEFQHGLPIHVMNKIEYIMYRYYIHSLAKKKLLHSRFFKKGESGIKKGENYQFFLYKVILERPILKEEGER